MVPWLRILPVGGASAAVLILALALTPPREPPHAPSPELALARGPLLDRNEHPEWPQFIVQAAFRRAGEILKLRDLPDAPMLVAPVALPPPAAQAPTAAAEPAPAALPSDSAVQSAAKALDAAPAPMQVAKPSADVDDVKAAPVPTAAPAETRVAVLPQERPPVDPEATGTISASADATTIPVDIGESSSDELPVVLPPERPPILRAMERERSSHVVPRKKITRRTRVAARPARARAAKPPNVQPASEINLFDSLFDAGKSNQRTPAAQKRGAAWTSENPPYPLIDNYPIGRK